MKTRIITAIIAALALSSCGTVVTPDGTKTTKPDNETIGLVGGFLSTWFAPKAEPAPKELQPVKTAPVITPDK